MSVHAIPAHGSAYFTCDHLGGKPEHRTTCRAAITVRPTQDGLWMDPAAIVPDDWRREGRAHLCPEHLDSTSVCSLLFPLSTPGMTTDGDPS